MTALPSHSNGPPQVNPRDHPDPPYRQESSQTSTPSSSMSFYPRPPTPGHTACELVAARDSSSRLERPPTSAGIVPLNPLPIRTRCVTLPLASVYTPCQRQTGASPSQLVLFFQLPRPWRGQERPARLRRRLGRASGVRTFQWRESGRLVLGEFDVKVLDAYPECVLELDPPVGLRAKTHSDK